MGRFSNMILPWGIHRSRHCVEFVPFALLFIAFLLTVGSEATAQEAVDSAAEEAGVSWFPAFPLRFTVGGDAGYDDHTLGSNAGTNSTTNSSGPGSFTARENVVLSYDRAREIPQMKLIGVGGFFPFFSRGTER